MTVASGLRQPLFHGREVQALLGRKRLLRIAVHVVADEQGLGQQGELADSTVEVSEQAFDVDAVFQ